MNTRPEELRRRMAEAAHGKNYVLTDRARRDLARARLSLDALEHLLASPRQVILRRTGNYLCKGDGTTQALVCLEDGRLVILAVYHNRVMLTS